MSDDLNKLDLFIKIIRMTETDNDGQTLVAIRKANSMLKAEGWDWDRLLRGKVKVIADPFAKVSQPAPQARAATYTKPAPPPPPPWQAPPKPTYAPDPFGGMGAPKPKPSQPQPQAARPQPPKQAPAGPLHFRKTSTGEWAIASYMKADQLVGQKVTLSKRDGSTSDEICGAFIEQDNSGHFLYKIAKATKWKNKFADQNGLGDFI